MTTIFNPVKIFSDIADMFGYRFIYGSRAFLNWEITEQEISNGEIFLAMFPFVEDGEHENSLPVYNVFDTVLWIGRKFDDDGTASSLDETEKQKYDRRLKGLRHELSLVLKQIYCFSQIDIIRRKTENELNAFSVNCDALATELSFRVDYSFTNDEL
jgi:hypothetical protein